MTTGVLLLGGECTGKSALAAALADQMLGRPVSVVTEVLRDFTARTGRPPLREEQEEIWRRQTHTFTEAKRSSTDGGLVVSDPAPVLTAVYSVQYFDDHSLLTPALEAIDPADVMVLCMPDIPWEADGIQRDGPAARQRTHDLLNELVLPSVRNHVLIASGPLELRVTKVLHALR